MTANRTLTRRTASIPPGNLDVHPVLENVYRNRNISDPNQLNYSLSNLLPPTDLSNIDDAVEIVIEAIQADASILIAGDFDADGATGSAVGYLALTAFGARKVQYLCPDRQEFGYGLTEKFVQFFASAQPDLVITVDNGITSLAGVRLAKELGMSVIVTDHHLPGEELPEADAIVNPRLPGDQFPSKDIAGVGVMFYLMIAVRRKLKEIGWFESEGIAVPNMADYLDLVAVGTVADVVPLDYNNRILVAQGLKRINAGQARYGVLSLLREGGKKIGKIVAEDLGYVVGPRINAAGRLDDISFGIKCLVSSNESEVLAYIQKLERLNIQRREMEAQMVESAKREVERHKLSIRESTAGICLYNADWHQGVVGLIASRLREITGMPAVIFAPGDKGFLRGSGRSVKGLNLRDVLANIAAIEPDIFAQYGGHAMAAGMTLPEANFSRFESLFQEELTRYLDGGKWENEILSDGEISQFDLEAAEQIRSGGPWGQQFEAPVFDGVFEIVNFQMLKDEHLKVRLRDSSSKRLIDGIFFRYSTYHDDLPMSKNYRIAFQLVANEFRGKKEPQLHLNYLAETHAPV